MSVEKVNLPRTLRVSDFPELKKLEGSFKTGIYKLVFPENSKGQLLKVKSGEMKGLNTTTLVADGRFVGTAGLEEIDLDDYSLNLLSRIKSYDYLAQSFNDLSARVHGLINRLEDQYQAQIRNMFILFKDISRKMPEFISNDNYAQLAMSNLSGLKIIAGNYFEFQFIDFSNKYSQIDYQQKSIHVHMNRLRECKSHSVFQALEMLIMIEIYEIMLSGYVTSRMIKAAKDSLEDRFNPIMKIISYMYQHTLSLINEYDNQTKHYEINYYQHLKYIEEINDFKCNLENVYVNVVDIREVISRSLNEDLGMDNIESVYIEFVGEDNLIEQK